MSLDYNHLSVVSCSCVHLFTYYRLKKEATLCLLQWPSVAGVQWKSQPRQSGETPLFIIRFKMLLWLYDVRLLKQDLLQFCSYKYTRLNASSSTMWWQYRLYQVEIKNRWEFNHSFTFFQTIHQRKTYCLLHFYCTMWCDVYTENLVFLNSFDSLWILWSMQPLYADTCWCDLPLL